MNLTACCPSCGMLPGSCRHTTEGQVTRDSEPLSADQVSSLILAPIGTKAPAIMGGWWYRTERGWKWNGPDGCGSTFPRPGGDWDGTFIPPSSNDPTRPESAVAPVPAAPSASAATRGGADRRRNNQMYDPKCRDLAEYMTSDRDLTEEQLDELSQDIQDVVEDFLLVLDHGAQS